MKLEELTESIVHINYNSQIELASTFLRFQASAYREFEKKPFTVDDFTLWYLCNCDESFRKSRFTYYEDVEGFGISSETLDPFYEGKFDPLSKREEIFLELFRKRRSSRFYIIGTHNSNGKREQRETLKHEIAHVLFSTNPEYRKNVSNILKEISHKKREEINAFLEKEGYELDEWRDETQAYILAGSSNLRNAGIKMSGLIRVSRKLNLVFERHYPKLN